MDDLCTGPVSSDGRRKLLSEMKRIRAVEEVIAERYAEQQMRCPTHLSIGQEAVAVGVCGVLSRADQVVSGHRAHAHYLAKGGCLAALVAELYGKSTGCTGGKGGSMHLVDTSVGFLGSTAIVGNTIPIGVGAALAARVLRTDHVCCVFFGDAAIEEGVFHEAANFAVVRRLPVVFVCENNLYSVYSPLRVRQPEGRPIWQFARGYGMHSECGDGNDVVDVVRKTSRAIHHAREGGGPAFLEFATYRWREHCGPNYDNDLGYRTEAEFKDWQSRDPITRLESELVASGELSTGELDDMVNVIDREIEDAFQSAKEAPFPRQEAAFEDLYRE